MIAHPEDDWQAGRNRLNHDWLKNKFSLVLNKAINVANEEIEDDEFAARFIGNALPEFKAEMQNARDLIGAFENSMSPSVLFDREPLCRLDDRHQKWMRQIVHLCWKSRIRASELIDTATKRLDETLAAYGQLRQCIDGKCGKLEGQQLACCRDELLTFRNAVSELGAAISTFPNRIRTV